MKEYGILDENDAALFTATLSALDINKFNNEVLVKIKIANDKIIRYFNNFKFIFNLKNNINLVIIYEINKPYNL
jgi:hypothetical protein